MDWFRWHVGTVHHWKIRYAAVESESKQADVIAVWAAILELASESDGQIENPPFNVIDTLLGLDSGRARKICGALECRGLLDITGEEWLEDGSDEGLHCPERLTIIDWAKYAPGGDT